MPEGRSSRTRRDHLPRLTSRPVPYPPPPPRVCSCIHRRNRLRLPTMIRLRSLLERGLKHPVLGPVLLVALVIVLAMVFLHFVEDSHEATSFGTACLALAAVLGSILLTPIVRTYRGAATSVQSNRGPPTVAFALRPRSFSTHDPPLILPLRR